MSAASVRIKALVRIIGGGIGVVLALAFSAYLASHGFVSSRGGIPAMILVIIPGVVALQGLVELLTGVELWQLAKKWDQLRWWQRGILGTIIAFSPVMLIVAGLMLFGPHL